MLKKNLLIELFTLFLVCFTFVACGKPSVPSTMDTFEFSGKYKYEYSIMLRYGDGEETGDDKTGQPFLSDKIKFK